MQIKHFLHVLMHTEKTRGMSTTEKTRGTRGWSITVCG